MISYNVNLHMASLRESPSPGRRSSAGAHRRQAGASAGGAPPPAGGAGPPPLPGVQLGGCLGRRLGDAGGQAAARVLGGSRRCVGRVWRKCGRLGPPAAQPSLYLQARHILIDTVRTSATERPTAKGPRRCSTGSVPASQAHSCRHCVNMSD